MRCRRPPLSSQNDQALIVSATHLLGVVERLVEGQARKTDVTADAFSSPPGMQALGAEAVKLGDERGRAFETILVVVHYRACFANGAVVSIFSVQIICPWGL